MIFPGRRRYIGAGWTLVAIGAGVVVASGLGCPVQARELAPDRSGADFSSSRGPTQISDPLQAVNRGMFSVDSTVNRIVAGPTRILGTVKWIPRPVRHGLFNAFENLEEPATLANDLMQRKVKRAGETTARFAVNLTIGLAGVIDVADKFGLKRTREDFGQTLAVYGVGPGPYFYVPLSGPTTLRDSVGGFVDGYFSPTRWLPMTVLERRGIRVIKYGVAPSTVGIRQVARGAAVSGETNDEYATLRQLYYDQRTAQIADLPNLADDPIASEPADRKPQKAGAGKRGG